MPPQSVYGRPEPAPHCASPCLNFITSLQLGLPSLAAASLLTLPLSQSSPPLSLSCLLLSRIRLLRHAACLGPCFRARRLRLGFLQDFPASHRGQGKRIARDFPVTWEKQEEVPGPSPGGRSPLHPGFQGRATRVAPVQWLLRVPLSPPACRRTGKKPNPPPPQKKPTFELLCLPPQAIIFHDSTAHFYLQSTPLSSGIKGPRSVLL